MNREEEIKELTRNLHSQFEKRIGFVDVVRMSIQWADAHQPNPWRDAKKELPMLGELVNIAVGKAIGFIRYIEPTDFIDNGVEYWMPIPELPKGGNA